VTDALRLAEDRSFWRQSQRREATAERFACRKEGRRSRDMLVLRQL